MEKVHKGSQDFCFTQPNAMPSSPAVYIFILAPPRHSSPTYTLLLLIHFLHRILQLKIEITNSTIECDNLFIRLQSVAHSFITGNDRAQGFIKNADSIGKSAAAAAAAAATVSISVGAFRSFFKRRRRRRSQWKEKIHYYGRKYGDSGDRGGGSAEYRCR